jgi:hypothetical protein
MTQAIRKKGFFQGLQRGRLITTHLQAIAVLPDAAFSHRVTRGTVYFLSIPGFNNTQNGRPDERFKKLLCWFYCRIRDGTRARRIEKNVVLRRVQQKKASVSRWRSHSSASQDQGDMAGPCYKGFVEEEGIANDLLLCPGIVLVRDFVFPFFCGSWGLWSCCICENWCPVG